nr:MAG TPA: major capsid protein [Caudoviricetes sp.]
MPINIYQTQTLVTAAPLVLKRPTFLRDRYFETTDNDLFVTEDVLVEYKDEQNRKLAPCVVPMSGGIAMDRNGYRTERYTPANVAPKRTLSIADLQKRGFGETVFSQKKPAEREAALLRQDMMDLGESIDSREEWMASQVLFNNGYTMKHYIDDYGGSKYQEYAIKFYDEDSNPAVYTPSAAWGTSSKAIMDDLYAIALLLKRRGLKASDVIFGDKVGSVIINNEYFQKLLDNRRLDLMAINPTELPEGVVYYGRMNVKGVALDLFCYTETYTDEQGTTQTFVPENKIVVTAPKMGSARYGAITVLEKDDNFYTYTGKRVPHVVADQKSGVKELFIESKPLFTPKYKNSAISATVLF